MNFPAQAGVTPTDEENNHMAKNRELKTRADGVKQHYNTGTSVTPNPSARDAFYERPPRPETAAPADTHPAPSGWARNADGGYSRASDLDEDDFLIDRGD